MSQSPINIHIESKGDPEKVAEAIKRALGPKPDVRVRDARRIAAAILNLTGTAAMCVAGYHFAGWWGVLAVNSIVLGPLNHRDTKP